MRFGFNDDWSVHARNLDELKRMGCDCVRFPVGAPLEPWVVDPIYEQLLAKQLRPYIVLGGWNPAPDAATYGSWVGPFADRYRQASFCLWNEPNHAADDHPNPLSVEQAIALNRAGVKAAKNANPDARVLYSSISPVGDWQAYHDRLYRAVPRGDVAMHLYPGGRMEGRLAKVAADYEFGKKYGRIHVTEIDMAAPWTTPDPDAPVLAAKAYDLLEGLGAKTTIFHSIDNHRAEAGALQQARRDNGK